VPEGDTIFRAARTLHRVLGGQVVTRFETQLPMLARVDHDSPLAGRTVESASALGKWLAIRISAGESSGGEFSGPLVLLTHMLMSGSWHIYRPGEVWQKQRQHMRVVIETATMLAVAFNVPIAEFHTAASLSRRHGFNRLGPDLLAPDFDELTAVAALENNPDLELGVALLNQSMLAGLGNVYKSEVCFVERVNPFQRVGSISRGQLRSLVTTARKLILANVTDAASGQIVTYSGLRRTTGSGDHSANLWVYRRTGAPCRRCGALIVSHKQGMDARTSFWCPVCQPISQSL
jgi:endonuclease VIII